MTKPFDLQLSGTVYRSGLVTIHVGHPRGTDFVAIRLPKRPTRLTKTRFFDAIGVEYRMRKAK